MKRCSHLARTLSLPSITPFSSSPTERGGMGALFPFLVLAFVLFFSFVEFVLTACITTAHEGLKRLAANISMEAYLLSARIKPSFPFLLV